MDLRVYADSGLDTKTFAKQKNQWLRDQGLDYQQAYHVIGFVGSSNAEAVFEWTKANLDVLVESIIEDNKEFTPIAEGREREAAKNQLLVILHGITMNSLSRQAANEILSLNDLEPVPEGIKMERFFKFSNAVDIVLNYLVPSEELMFRSTA